jgi:anti-sigma regulatory factor (Ser/Thr protein kinase)
MPAGKYQIIISCNDFIEELEIIVPDQGKEFIDLDKKYKRSPKSQVIQNVN